MMGICDEGIRIFGCWHVELGRGECDIYAIAFADLVPWVTCAEEHRELVRKCLYAILGSGYSPLEFFDRDYNSYFLMAETLACVDLSTVRLDIVHAESAHLHCICIVLSLHRLELCCEVNRRSLLCDNLALS